MWNVSCTDKAGNLNTSLSQNFTIDQIAPVLVNFSINGTGAVDFLGSDSSANPPFEGASRSWAQGRSFTAIGNFTDNLTKLLEADLQFYNTSLGDWQTINTTKDDKINNITSATSAEAVFNLTFTPPSGRNEFEGNNVSFRLLVNDTLGNMNKSSNIVNITININDTYAPTITINSSADGAAMVNGSNISDTTPRISWAVDENNDLQSINISFDNTHIGQTGSGLNVDGCNKYAFFTSTQSSQVKNPEYFRNGSFTVTDDQAGGCPTLTNGSHSIIVTAIDVWGNELVEFHNFSIQSGSIPGLAFVNLTTPTTLWSKDNDNNSNITSLIGLGIGGVSNGGLTGENIQSLTYTSSCDSTEITFINNTVIYPFNRSSACKTESENRTVTITVTDTAGNFNTIVLGFLVDNVGPSFSSIESPTDGQTFVNAKTALNFTMLDYDQAISSFGYYLDGSDGLVTMNISAAIGSAGTSITENNLTNFTSGTHTIKFTVNDTLGNARNSSVITFTQVGLIRPNEVNSSINEYLLSINPGIAAINTSVRSKGADGVYIESNETAVNDTFEIFLNLNASSDTHNMNVTITEINGSGANWGKINFSVFINDTKFENSIQNNFTMNLLTPFVLFNGSIDEFLSNENDYYGVIVLPYNVSKNGTGTAQEIWYFEDENDLTARTNVSQCTTSTVYSRTSTSLPCWNYTSGGRTIVTVPHFSGAGAVNDTGSPSVSINSPATSLGISEVIPNVTVSNDATDCKYIINGTDSSVSSNISSATLGTIGNDNICTWSEIRFKDGVYNITFNVTDASGNLNLSVNRTFTMADSTAPNSGTSISSSPGETSATVTISGVNESVNATVFYGTGNTSFTNSFMQTAFSKSPSVSFTGLTASTVYYYNVTLYDYNGNSVFNSTVFTFTTDAASTTTTTTTTTTTSSGGGGGAATVSKVADSKAQVWSTVPAGSSFSLDVDKATIAVTSVAVNDVKSELKNVDLEVQALKENPLSTEAAAKVYQYLRINKKNIVDSDAEGFKVSFRVTKAWLTENSLASGDISLYRYKSGWNELVTKVTGTDSTYVNYEADTPGFSSFAVGTKTGVVVEEEVPEGEEVAPGEEAPGEVAPPEEVEAPKAIEAPGKAPVAWLIAAVVIILGIILIVAYQKKKQQV
jgi:PGF-pre-PGF domain-containing protein